MNGRIALALALSLCADAGLSFAEGRVVARIGQSEEFLELEHQVNGQITKNYLPLHRAGGVRYFSAGVGLEERAAEYPPFSLKLVFTAGGKPFLAGVDVTIQPAKGGTAIRVPREHVEGPWLFVDLPPGIYDIAATHVDREQTLKGVKVESGKRQTLHLRWTDDRGMAAKIPLE
jgi:hypothetical protein